MIRRPALAHRVRARRHVVEGRAFVVLHDVETGRSAQVGTREWLLLEVADGTRDVDGVRLAAARRGAHARREHVESFFSELARVGWLVEGPPVGAAATTEEPAPVASPAPSAARGPGPLRLLPNYRLRCDGGGSCCRLYQTVLFGPLDAARARALAPDVQAAGEDPDAAFFPERGNRRLGVVPTLVHGRCAYLAEDQRCRIHAAGGVLAKPAGCRLFPLSFVDDGVEVRVGVSPECACVAVSALAVDGAGEPLLGDEAKTRADLPEFAEVLKVPDLVEVGSEREPVTRAEYLRFEGMLTARLEGERELAEPAWAAWALGDALEEPSRPSLDDAFAAWDDPPPLGDLRATLGPLVERLERTVHEDAEWRAEDDLSRQAARWMLEAAVRLEADGPRAPTAREVALERFHLRALSFSHRFALEGPLSSALRAAAVRLLLGRAMADVLAREGVTDPATRAPAALVEALTRAAGLA